MSESEDVESGGDKIKEGSRRHEGNRNDDSPTGDNRDVSPNDDNLNDVSPNDDSPNRPGSRHRALRDSKDFLESPIDLCINSIDQSEMIPLQWENYQSNPLFLKMTNTTNTVVLNGLYPTRFVPTLNGGPLPSPYKFVQLHFHWGERDDLGSEHQVEGEAFPLEAHVVLYKSDYGDYEIAKSMEDGIIILVYMFQIQQNSRILEFTKHLPKLKDPYSQIPLDTVSLESFLPPLIADYILYFGYMASSCKHGVFWLISRTTLAVTEAEMEDFRKISGSAGASIGHNFREIKPTLDRAIFMVNAEKDMKRVLHVLLQGKSQTAKSKGRRESKRGSRRASRKASKRSSKVAKRSSKVAKRSSKVAKRSSKVAKK
ncbi:hypothetical protein GE061_005116 [Apolygus lucorum]|uniref:Carbonic anhydrase n=1 Tax=Apolygus lucorum TaxID=248454 RepID=A0A8S9WVF4_APOLU|nr:hypothetical protein GE061_005116 [Apolygus lucorum]